MIAYVVKYWATDGIRAVDGAVNDNGHLLTDSSGAWVAYGKRDYALTLKEAREKVEDFREKKIKNLKKQIDKLKVLEVKVHERTGD
jgi:hypothetical protein